MDSTLQRLRAVFAASARLLLDIPAERQTDLCTEKTADVKNY